MISSSLFIIVILKSCYSVCNLEDVANEFAKAEYQTFMSTEKNKIYGTRQNIAEIITTKNIDTKVSNDNSHKSNEEVIHTISNQKREISYTITEIKSNEEDISSIELNEAEKNLAPKQKNEINEIDPDSVMKTKVSNDETYKGEFDENVNKNSSIRRRNTVINETEQEDVEMGLSTETVNTDDNDNVTELNETEYSKTATMENITIYETTQETEETTTIRTKKNRTVILQELQFGTNSVDIKEYPYIVSIQKEMIHSCCGTIVSSFWVLTAAHCLTLPGSILRLVDVIKVVVVAGQSQLGLGKMQMRRVKDIYLHSRFVKNLLLYNIGMINLFQPFDLNDYVNVVHLSSSISKPYKFFGSCYVISWTVYRKDFLSFDKLKALDENSRKLMRVPELQRVDLPTITIEECFDRIEAKEFLTERDHICTEYGTYRNVSCATDAGSPLICDDRQYGIFSWGIGCDDYDYPGVFTNVASFRKWIDNIGSDPNEFISRNEGRTLFESSTLVLIGLCCVIQT